MNVAFSSTENLSRYPMELEKESVKNTDTNNLRYETHLKCLHTQLDLETFTTHHAGKPPEYSWVIDKITLVRDWHKYL